ncbi:MAG: transposase [Cyanobacteria bacterium P01_H01_bin.150]
MHYYRRVEEILRNLRPAFSRDAAYEWFVVLIWGILLCTGYPAITSYLNAVGLTQDCYSQALHWFHSSSWSVEKLSLAWHEWLLNHPQVHRLKGQPVYLGDGIKVSKEGRKMPAVKQLHQESENVTKAEWIRGHYFGAITLLFGAGSCFKAVPVTFELQDGIKTTKDDETTLVDKMSALCRKIIKVGSYIVLDAYFASKTLISEFRESNLHLITRVRINTVAKHPKPAAIEGGRGRPRIWGESLKLRTLFDEEDSFTTETLPLYGKMVTLKYRSIDLYWDCPHKKVRFVLAVWPEGKQIILLSTDVTLSPAEIVTAYSWRFKIEVTFRSFIQLLSGFSYRFWMKDMTETKRWPQDLILAQYKEKKQQLFNRKIEAFERFVLVNAIVLAILQLLSLEMPAAIWKGFPRWFRTLPSNGYPSEQIVLLTLQEHRERILAKSPSDILLAKFIAAKIPPTRPWHLERFVR